MVMTRVKMMVVVMIQRRRESVSRVAAVRVAVPGEDRWLVNRLTSHGSWISRLPVASCLNAFRKIAFMSVPLPAQKK